jgi:type I restriction enzyme M protein
MNLALYGLSGDIRLGNSYYEDLHHSLRTFDFVMANPPFNVNGVDKDKLVADPRFAFGLPRPRQCQLSMDSAVLVSAC